MMHASAVLGTVIADTWAPRTIGQAVRPLMGASWHIGLSGDHPDSPDQDIR